MLFPILLVTILLIMDVGADTRSGRCPAAQYVSSSLSCSTEGDDSVCPWDYKCCPLTNGMKCFSPCPKFVKPCNLECSFGLNVNPSPCTICECAPDPCLTASCPLGTKCITKDYEPCAIKGRCGLKTQCVTDPSIQVDPNPKPKKCPDYWPLMGGGLQACQGPDALCPGEQKCCRSPSMIGVLGAPNSVASYCVDPCEDLSKCTLQCSHGLKINGGCRICECAPDPCEKISCPPGEICRLLPTPCAFYPGRPPCPMAPVCMKRN